MDLNIDLSQFNNIDFNDVSRWPIAVKVLAIVVLCVVTLAAGLWLDTRRQLETLEAAQKKEEELKASFTEKQHQASNIVSYKDQMEEMRRSFGTMLRQLPSKTEVAELLVDISHTGLENGLEFDLFKPESESPAEFYAELPIKIEVIGTYHEFGQFISDVAILPRIVTLHDFDIGPRQSKSNDGLLKMKVTAKTYRYLEEDEIATPQTSNSKKT